MLLACSVCAPSVGWPNLPHRSTQAALPAIPASRTRAGPRTARRANATRIRTSRDEIAVVHNGIIENHEELRTELKAAGYVFTSETDTEVSRT
jgi:glucosamine 6-phosphate synthetase-like amidotransferase/phosphosugar isomerase protein